MRTSDASPKVTSEVEGPDAPAHDWIRPAHQERSRLQRDRILQAGERVFAEQGYFDAHVSQIVREAGCSVGSFYRRFKDKEALFFALQTDMYEASKIHIAKFFANPLCSTLPITKIVFRLLDNSAWEIERIIGYYRALFEISLKGKDVWLNMRDLEVRQAEGLKGLLEGRGLALDAEFVDTATLAIRAVNGMIISMLLHGPGPYPHDDINGRKALTSLLMRALKVEPDPAALATVSMRPPFHKPRA